MKKTYNVISRNSLKFSVMFFFTLFFLGMSSSASAQFATSSASAGNAVDADYSITQKAQIGVTDEVALEILETEMIDVREEALRDDLTNQQEAENSARNEFLQKTLDSFKNKNLDLKTSLVIGQQAMELLVTNYNAGMQNLVDTEGIAREYVNRLK